MRSAGCLCIQTSLNPRRIRLFLWTPSPAPNEIFKSGFADGWEAILVPVLCSVHFRCSSSSTFHHRVLWQREVSNPILHFLSAALSRTWLAEVDPCPLSSISQLWLTTRPSNLVLVITFPHCCCPSALTNYSSSHCRPNLENRVLLKFHPTWTFNRHTHNVGP